MLAHHLRQLKLLTVLREYEKVAAEAARDGQGHVRYLLRLVELELRNRARRTVERRIRAARFPVVMSFDTFDLAIPSLNNRSSSNWPLVNMSSPATASSTWATVARVRRLPRLAACQRGLSVAFTTAAGLVNQIMEARDEKRPGHRGQDEGELRGGAEGRKVRRFTEFLNGTASFSRVERIVARTEAGMKGPDTRFVASSS